MDFVTLSANLTVSLAHLTKLYLISPLINIFFWCSIYLSASLAIKIVKKIRYEIYNEDLKFKPQECSNKVIVITGSTSGIGLAASKFLLGKGFTIIACYFSKEEPGYEALESESQQAEPKLFLVELDIRSESSVKLCLEKVEEILSGHQQFKFHALVNVAGVGHMSKFQWQSRESIKSILATNLFGPIMMTREFMPLLVKSAPESRLVNVSSPLGLIPVEYNTVYAATKAGLIQFTNALRLDTISYNLKLTTILPGNVIKKTSILHPSLIQTRRAALLNNLTQEEIELYKQELDNHEKLRSKLENSKDKAYNLSIDITRRISGNLIRMGLLVSGALGEDKLEDSNLMNGFDNALRMRDPPREIFSGNRFFEIITSSILEMLSHVAIVDWSYLLKKSNVKLLG